MKAAGIICEFNPFHNGHNYLFETVRQDINPDALVCVMSGNFVQRGQAAMWNKYVRAKAAINCGADIVIELPTYAAVNSASSFAKAAVDILNGLGVVDTIAFGSECGDINQLVRIAELTDDENEDFSADFRKAIDEGISYPKAYQKAVLGQIKGLSDDFFAGSNNILGIEYLKWLKKTDSEIKPYTLQRNGCGHDAINPTDDFASGSYIRKLFEEDKMQHISDFLPVKAAEIICSSESFTKEDENILFQLIRYKLLNSSPEELSKISEISEGLENLLKKAVLKANTIDELIHSVKSKRYTYARISRILIQTLLCITKDDVLRASLYPYARVLAFNSNGREIIKKASEIGQIPIITNINSQVKETDDIMAGLSIDLRAGNLYSIIKSNNIYENSDKVCNCILCNI